MEPDSLSTDSTTSPSPHIRSMQHKTPPSTSADSAVDTDMAPTTGLSDSSIMEHESATGLNCNEEQDGSEESEGLDALGQTTQTISDKMRHLAAAAWALEQDDEMTDVRRRKIHKILRKLEATVEDDGASDIDSGLISDASDEDTGQSIEQKAATMQPEAHPGSDDHVSDSASIKSMTETDLHSVQTALAATVDAMRLRQQEQRHLHTLTVQKIEAIAQRCLAQEARIQDLLNDISNLRIENQTLGQQNDRMHESIEFLERERELKEVTVTAMTSAVAGLEGWIESTVSPSRQHTPVRNIQNGGLNGSSHLQSRNGNKNPLRENSHSPLRPITDTNGTTADPRPRRSIVKGRGRFRGRHYIDDHDEIYSHTNDNNNNEIEDPRYNAQDFHDGVKAWIRGFRDVEECASSPIPFSRPYSYSPSRREKSMREPVDLDEWGDFENPS